jgi:hypothetical protein
MSKYIFTLRNINIENVNNRCGLNIQTNDNNHKTNLNDIIEDFSKKINFYDETKDNHTCQLSIVNLNSTQIYHCFWDHHPIEKEKFTCPIKYIPTYVTKHYYSYTSKNNFLIKERVKYHKDYEYEIVLNNEGYYECEGVFCSWECIIAYIKDNWHNPKYNQSLMLVGKIYEEQTGQKYLKINPAPHWRLLKVYGGSLAIKEFRKSFGYLQFIEYGTKYPLSKPIGYLYEENVKLS